MTEPRDKAASFDGPIIEGRQLSKVFSTQPGLWAAGRQRYVRAVDRATLQVHSGEIVGLVGESGCGKSTLGRLMIRLEPPTAGTVLFEGEDIGRLRGRALRRKRRFMQLIFQDPSSSLNPRFTVRETLTEAIRAHRLLLAKRELNGRMAALLAMVGLSAGDLDRYPREFSGGQRQRIAIARALAVEPRFIVADEPISSLDLSIQSQIVQLLESLRDELSMSLLLISHDLDVVRHLSKRVAVMYLGRLVETAPTEALFRAPLHPYTRALVAASLSPDPDRRTQPPILSGDPPSPLEPPKGCHFHPRCPHRNVQCELVEPTLREVGPQHSIMCHFDL